VQYHLVREKSHLHCYREIYRIVVLQGCLPIILK
jgi:hypothetical protein